MHLTETCEADSPNLITQVTTTVGTLPDVKATLPIEESLAERDLRPKLHIVDAGYMSNEVFLESKEKQQLELIGPLRLDVSWQKVSANGYNREDFKINWEEEKVECPPGMTSYKWQTQKDKEDGPSYILVRFRPKECANCVAREQCTRNARLGRNLHSRPQSEYEAY